MNKKEIIETLEKKFLEFHNNMDLAMDDYRRTKNEVSANTGKIFASQSIAIIECLALINGVSMDKQNEDLYNKFNLWRSE